VGFCEEGNEHSGPTECTEFIDRYMTLSILRNLLSDESIWRSQNRTFQTACYKFRPSHPLWFSLSLQSVISQFCMSTQQEVGTVCTANVSDTGGWSVPSGSSRSVNLRLGPQILATCPSTRLMNVLAAFTWWSHWKLGVSCDHPLWLQNLTVSELIKHVWWQHWHS
jgi:hypothetical protein